MKKSGLKSGMVLEVLHEGDTERFLLTELADGTLVAFNNEYTLGDVDYYFDENLNNNDPEAVELLGVYVLSNSDWNIWKAINLDECLELIYKPQAETPLSSLIDVLQRADSLGILEANLSQLLNPHELIISDDVIGDLVDYLETDINCFLD